MGSPQVSLQVAGYRLSSAELSDCGRYRYRLTRQWARWPRPSVLWIMLNPSTATADVDDPTIRKCIGFSKRWGAGSLEVVNLFAFRATHPRELKRAELPVGEANNAWIARAFEGSHLHRVVAWGAGGGQLARVRAGAIAGLLRGELRCLGETNDGDPRHPLMLPYTTQFSRWEPYRRTA